VVKADWVVVSKVVFGRGGEIVKMRRGVAVGKVYWLGLVIYVREDEKGFWVKTTHN
jgi:hypothetical protein